MRSPTITSHSRGIVPPLVILAACVLLHAVLTLEPFGAFDAVPLAKAGKIFCWLGGFVLRQVLGRAEICVNLIKISARFFFSRDPLKKQLVRVYLVLRFVFTLRIAPISGLISSWAEIVALSIVWWG